MFTEKQHDLIGLMIGRARHPINALIPEAKDAESAFALIEKHIAAMFVADNCDFDSEQFAKACQGEEIVPMDWDKVEAHFIAVLDQYKELVGVPGVNVMYAMTRTFDPLLRRFKAGERTQDLYERMVGVE